MQPSPFAPPPMQQVRKGTPFLHCAAGASIWYAALIAAFVAITLKTQSGWGNLVPALLIGGVFWVITTTVTWLVLMKVRVQQWVLIPLTLPIYLAVWFVLYVIVGGLSNLYMMLLSRY
ncbi:hypothetical protein ACIA8G_29675 [Lentzea sp. NPDC051213]|uniref:hypothetical protein n=1 Tax=Lentzea sp. NPDC051213 TaxID=3364126 RepID=UPI003799321B